jgi:hypothetical protein
MKAIIFDTENFKGTFKEATENKLWADHNIELKKFALIKAILFEKGFLWKLCETIKYALIHGDTYRGTNASDILLFENSKSFRKIWKR